VRFHLEPRPRTAAFNLYLDPKLADETGAHRKFDLSRDDYRVLTLFLDALEGDEVDRFVAGNPN
jgi:hypothetical protein